LDQGIYVERFDEVAVVKIPCMNIVARGPNHCVSSVSCTPIGSLGNVNDKIQAASTELNVRMRRAS
jgi:hypothetical protein